MGSTGRVFIFLTSIIVVCCLGGCEDDPEPSPTEIYYGQFTTHRIILFESRTDSVAFTLDGDNYFFDHFTHNTGLCESWGTFRGDGTNELEFAPTAFTFDNCDSTRIPAGAFDAVFRKDSLYLTRDADSVALDIKYDIRLKKGS